MKQALVSIFADNEVFAAAPGAALEALAAQANRASFDKGQTILEAGAPSDALYAVLSGRVRIYRVSEEGDEVTLGLIEAGKIFGEIAVVDGGGRTASAVATAPSVLAVVPRAAFLRFLEGHNAATMRLLNLVCGRLRNTISTLDTVAFLGLEARLARLLTMLAKDYGVERADGVLIELRLGQKELGAFIATTRESISKQLTLWRAEGLVDKIEGRLLIRDVEELAERAQMDEQP